MFDLIHVWSLVVWKTRESLAAFGVSYQLVYDTNMDGNIRISFLDLYDKMFLMLKNEWVSTLKFFHAL